QLEVLRCRIVGVERLNPEGEVLVARVTETSTSATAMDKDTDGSIFTVGEVSTTAKFGETWSLLQKSIAQQQYAMSRLARLTRLMTLDLDMEWRDIHFLSAPHQIIRYTDGEYYTDLVKLPQDTLTLTLESGLSQLAMLKDSGVLGLMGSITGLRRKRWDGECVAEDEGFERTPSGHTSEGVARCQKGCFARAYADHVTLG
ncbi:MAG: hypothetical protein J3R72DRAFT_510135, partial [Linnemannia gamsii]